MKLTLTFPRSFLSGPDAGSSLADTLRILADQVEGWTAEDLLGPSIGLMDGSGNAVGELTVAK
jgi:hypothetical protein